MELSYRRFAPNEDVVLQRDLARQSLSDAESTILVLQDTLRDVVAERQTLRDRLAATLWELRKAKRAVSMVRAVPLNRDDIAWAMQWCAQNGYLIDDQVAWRLSELERKLATWEGE